MPHFFFHRYIGRRFVEDREGSEHRDLDAARRDAFSKARALLLEMASIDDKVDGHRFELWDRKGYCVLVIPLKHLATSNETMLRRVNEPAAKR